MRGILPTKVLLLLLAGGLLPAALPVLADPALWPLVPALWAGLLGGALLDLAALAGPIRLEDAAVPEEVGVGRTMDVEIRWKASLLFPLEGKALLQVEPPLESGGERPVRLERKGGRVLLPLEAPRRGRGRLVRAWLELRGPLRLLRRVRSHPLRERAILVTPDLGRVKRMLLALGPADPVRLGSRPQGFRGGGGEFDALEAYVPGMDPRGVDWKASARHQTLLVRRYRLERNQRMILVLDRGRLMGEVLEGLTRLDHAVHAALLLAWAGGRAGDLVGAFAYGSRPGGWVPPSAGRGTLPGIRRFLGGLQLEEGETNHAWGMRTLAGKLRRRSLVVVLTEFTDPAMAALMVENTALLARRHKVLFLVMDDPFLEEILDRRPAGRREAARAAAAARIRREREKVLGRLASLGVRIARGRPGKAAAAAVEAYLDIKRKAGVG